MCGLVFVSKSDNSPARKAVWKRYLAQKTRGQKGFGYVAMKNGKILNVSREMYELDIEKTIRQETGSEILFHHRYPTSTENMVEATHPIEVKNPILEYDYYLAHNGIISNDTELKKDHEARGFVYSTLIRHKTFTRLTKYTSEEFNDSEALAVEAALCIDGKKDTIDTRGSAAFICLQADKATGVVKAVYYGRNSSNPLKMHRDKNFISICSEGMGETVAEDTLFKMDVESGLITERPLKIGGWAGQKSHYADDDEEYGGYYGLGWDNRYRRHAEIPPSIAQFLPTPENIAERALNEALLGEEVIDFNPTEDDILHPDEATDKAYADYADLEDIVADLDMDLDVLEQRKQFLIGMGDEKGEEDILVEIEKKKKEKEAFQAEMYKIAFDAGAFDTTG